MTRTHKSNDVPHNHPEAETAFEEHHIPKFFAKSGPVDQDPKKVKKNGGGKGNWGQEGDEIDDLEGFAVFKPRRRSNSKSHFEEKVASKFDLNDPDPVFEEHIHGPGTHAPLSSDNPDSCSPEAHHSSPSEKA